MKRVRHGNGIQLYGKTQTGETCRYEGQWELDRRTGRGSCLFPDGTRYAGDFKLNVIHGHGHFTWVDGHSYNGEWVSGRMEGNGEFSYPSGQVIKGRFIDNQYVDVWITPAEARIGGDETAGQPDARGCGTRPEPEADPAARARSPGREICAREPHPS